ncbi:alanyl-tRNA synthetase [Leuconostoc citreum]|uniref:alanyl-tRNA synthetase n=1 Tax=Leuconostoc citreum TaxID=33964 RepID=UPI0032E02FC2
MDVTINKRVRDVMPDLKDKELVEKVVDEKPVKSRLGILVLMIVGVLVVIFGSLIIYAMTTTHKTSQSSTGIPSPKVTKNVTTSKYVAGRDYKITYSNQNVIDKGVLDKALEESNGKNINFMMDTSEDGGNMAKVEVYYNKDKNLLVERLFENGYQDNKPTQTVGYDLSEHKMNLEKTYPTDYLNQPLVYKWEKLAK